MREIKRNYWNPAKTAQGMTLCSGCPFLSTPTCGLKHEIRNMKIKDSFVPSSKTCNLENVTWTVIASIGPDISVEQKTG